MVTILDVGDDNGNESLTVYVVNYVDDRSATHMLCWPLIFDFIFVILNAFFHKKNMDNCIATHMFCWLEQVRLSE